jgi:hypothetical protein
MRILLLSAFALLLVIPTTAGAQSVTVDEGVFRITIGGEVVGTESFSIRRTGSGDDVQVIATAEIQIDLADGPTDMRPALHAMGRDMAVYAYQIKVSGATQEEVSVEEGDRRYINRVRTERGERERELRAAPGTLLLDMNVAHQFYFLAPRLTSSPMTLPIIAPREGRQYEMRASEVGMESIQIGGTSIQARHLRLEGDGGTRDIWIDEEGRVLRVEHPDRGYVAVRESAP